MNSTHVIFDLDGTLIDSKQEIIATYKKVFSDQPPQKEVDYSNLNYGATLQSILESVYGLDNNIVAKAKAKFSEIYDYSDFENTLLYPSVYNTLSKLHENNFVLHIATNKRLTPTLKILEAKKISSFFLSIKASDMLPGKVLSKELMVREICSEFNIHKGVMVGDSAQDIEAGLSSNLQTIAALYGYEKKEELIKKNPKFVIQKFNEIYTILTNEI